MIDTTTFLLKNAYGRAPQFGEEYRTSRAARNLYRRAQLSGRIGVWWAALREALVSRNGGQLLNLDAYVAGRPVAARSSARLRTVNLRQIRGSVGRQGDFDADFHPIESNTEQRWMRVATAREEGRGLPPVQLIRVGETFFVQDGHHRVSVARARGELDIEAEVTEWTLAG
jgi:hypothetical protein